MKDRRKFYKKIIIFHLILYPLVTWFLISVANQDRLAKSFIIGIFAVGMILSLWSTCIQPLIRLKKEEKKLETKKVINNDYIN
jgi:hypothetical protein